MGVGWESYILIEADSKRTGREGNAVGRDAGSEGACGSGETREYKRSAETAESRRWSGRSGHLPASRQQVHSPNAITKRYNIAVTVTVSMSGGCICACGRTISQPSIIGQRTDAHPFPLGG